MPNLPDSTKDASVLISPTDPVSVGSMVKLTCSCRGSPPVVHFIWFMASDDRLELISVNTKVYGFNVSNSDRGRLFCGCANFSFRWIKSSIMQKITMLLCYSWSTVRTRWSYNEVMKILRIIILISTLVILNLWDKPFCDMLISRAWLICTL